MIERKTLASQVREEILRRIRAGEVAWGESINEVKLANELNVSRTPVREALTYLASAGYIEISQMQGFSYPKRNVAQLREIAPILAELESLAIRLTPAREIPKIGKELLQQAKAFSELEVAHGKLMEIDDDWHHLMISACANSFLVSEIEDMRRTMHKFESLLVSDNKTVNRIADEHIKIAESMIALDLEKTHDALVANWTNGISRVIDLA